MKLKLFSLSALALASLACNELESSQQYGEISVALKGEPQVEVVSKAVETLDPTSSEAANYTVRIYDSANTQKYEAAYNVFKTQTLPLGTYYVTAENCDEAAAESSNEGKGQMRLYGKSADITLTAENISQTATIACAVANAKLSVQFDSSVSGRFDNLQVVLLGSLTGHSVTVQESASLTETWFNPQDVSYTISGTFDPSGLNKSVTHTGSLTLSAKDNYIINVKVSLENGQIIVPQITYDTTINDPSTENGEFNPYL